MAILIARTDLPGRSVAGVLLGLLLFVPLYLQAAAWQAGFGVQGWCTLVWDAPVWIDGWRGAIWIHAAAAVPWVALIVGAGLCFVEPELEEDALLNATAPVVLWRVTLRCSLASLAAAALWVAVTAAGEMTVTDLFQVRTYAEELYTELASGTEPGEAALETLPGAALTSWLVVGALVLCANLVPRDRPLTVRRRLIFHLGRWRVPLALLTAAAVLLLVGVPLGNLCYKAGVLVTQTDAGRIRSWSLGKCLAMVATSPGHFAREFGWSLTIGALAATAAVAVAIPLAWWGRKGGARALPALLIAAFGLAVPGPVVGLGLIWLFNRPESPVLTWLYDRSIAAPWAALVLRGLPPAILVLWHALRTVPQETLDSAALEGAGPWTRLWRIALPQRRPAIAAAWLLAMAVALGELGASILVVPPGVKTLSIQVFDLLHYGVEDQVAGICLALVAMFALLSAAIGWLAYSKMVKQP
ncbi:MAG: ABC transporter permease [Pirellulales bacterium]